MEKFWEKASQTEYQKLFDILNTESLIEKETYKKFAIELFEIAKNQLDCKHCKLKFVDNLQNNLGVASVLDNSVTLNLSKMEKQTLYKTVSTIYHELTHIRQDIVGNKKKIGIFAPAEFPFVRCYGDERFLPADILGINPFFFYYTSQHEKQARDVGSECAMELFVALKNIAQTRQTKNGTRILIDRCVCKVKARWDKENANNNMATLQIKEFFKHNPNFIQVALDKIKQEFVSEASRYSLISKERYQCEYRFNCRIGSLVLLGCDENIKEQILNFVSSNFVNKGEIFTAFISVIDSPYSKVTQNDLCLLFKLASRVNCPKEILFNYLTNWDKNYLSKVANDLVLQKNQNNTITFDNNDFE